MTMENAMANDALWKKPFIQKKK